MIKQSFHHSVWKLPLIALLFLGRQTEVGSAYTWLTASCETPGSERRTPEGYKPGDANGEKVEYEPIQKATSLADGEPVDDLVDDGWSILR